MIAYGMVQILTIADFVINSIFFFVFHDYYFN